MKSTVCTFLSIFIGLFLYSGTATALELGKNITIFDGQQSGYPGDLCYGIGLSYEFHEMDPATAISTDPATAISNVWGDLDSRLIDVTTLSRSVLTGFTAHFTMECSNDDLMAQGTAPVPEPATILLMGFGLLGIAGFTRKKFKFERQG